MQQWGRTATLFHFSLTASQEQFCYPERRKSALQEVSFLSHPCFQFFSRPHVSIFALSFLDHCHSLLWFLLGFFVYFCLLLLSFSLLLINLQSCKSITPLSALLQTNYAYFLWHVFVPVFPGTSESRMCNFIILDKEILIAFLSEKSESWLTNAPEFNDLGDCLQSDIMDAGSWTAPLHNKPRIVHILSTI